MDHVLVHEAVPISRLREGARTVQGERELIVEEGTPFDCFFIEGSGGTEDRGDPRGQRVRRASNTILFQPEDREGQPVNLSSRQEVLITAEELGMERQRWQIDGEPTTLAGPGFLVGFEARLIRVED